MSECCILPPRHEHMFEGATGCTKEAGHRDEHNSILSDGTAIEWKTDWECDCCLDEEVPDMCIVWKEILREGK